MRPAFHALVPLLGSFAVFVAEPAYAYIGPGAGLTAIGTVIALLGGILLAIVGFVWYPIKRVMRSRARANRDAAVAKQAATGPELAAKDGQ
jgi:hypothetical protein